MAQVAAVEAIETAARLHPDDAPDPTTVLEIDLTRRRVDDTAQFVKFTNLQAGLGRRKQA